MIDGRRSAQSHHNIWVLTCKCASRCCVWGYALVLHVCIFTFIIIKYIIIIVIVIVIIVIIMSYYNTYVCRFATIDVRRFIFLQYARIYEKRVSRRTTGSRRTARVKKKKHYTEFHGTRGTWSPSSVPPRVIIIIYTRARARLLVAALWRRRAGTMTTHFLGAAETSAATLPCIYVTTPFSRARAHTPVTNDRLYRRDFFYFQKH